MPELPADPERVRAVIERAVRSVCPRWLAGDRDDLVQAALVRVVRACREGKESETLGASYLWRAAHSAVMDEVRRRRRSRETSLDEAMNGTTGEDPEQQARRAELRRAILAGLHRLPEPRRWAVLLCLYGFSLADSARVLGWTAKRVDNQRYQGLAELRRFLEKLGFEP